MIRFFANRYTREEVRALRESILAAHTHLIGYGDNCETVCDKCHYYRPCLDLANFLKRLDEILAIPEEVPK